MNQYTGNKVQFGLAIPQGWRGGDLSLQQENDSIGKSTAAGCRLLGLIYNKSLRV